MSTRDRVFVVFGDGITLAITTAVGFMAHGETGTAFAPRMLATFLPLMAGWFLIAPWLGLFDEHVVLNPRRLWRPPLAMLLGAPIAGILRAALLGSSAQPIFVLVLGSSAGLFLLIWRGLYYFILKHAKIGRSSPDGERKRP
jgi:hypothetical protein